MTYNEVMIYDWVLDASTGEPVRFNIPDFITNPTRLICNCKPIPLTAEILEKNGMKKVPEISLIIDNELNHEPMLHYVHELQHALRLCGLRGLADNFKID